ncbi:hypothetical protein M378DRAFT_70393 [Amanita muscaria Koide BX008]|uniref:Gag-like protein n=1 Tax=Amanita muscaria (strain Koide BX008) TaxID=946122 RepID=A0A0C2XJ46_AMAMK|nr:hypothetical protein M378DRAFT_70393 [Amanita muscaria Koide BX008]
MVPHPKNPTILTAIIKLYDNQAGHMLKALCRKSVFVAGANRRIRPWINKPAARQCIVCQRWGHTQQNCTVRSPFCTTCSGPHPTETHFVDCEMCHVANADPRHCTHVKCINCNGPHIANSQECEWYKARSNSKALEALDKRKKNMQEAERQARSA